MLREFMLLMKKQFYEAIRSGRKTTTLRFWRWAHMRPGSVHSVRGLGLLRVDSVEPIQPQDLTDDDARADGFADLRELTRALEDIYSADYRAKRKLFRVRFTYLSAPPTPARTAPGD